MAGVSYFYTSLFSSVTGFVLVGANHVIDDTNSLAHGGRLEPHVAHALNHIVYRDLLPLEVVEVDLLHLLYSLGKLCGRN